MLVRGPCLLAGVESPTHALRADADPGARSASTTYITLAESHQYDRNLEIILHPSEPHVPHVILEEGSMSFKEYEQQIRSRRDFSRVVKKDSSFDKKVEFVRKRFHKDIAFNPVLMLNFCPDLQSIATEFGHVTREIIFLIDRSGSMSGIHIEKIKEAMLVAVKSLPPGTLLNIIGFGSNVKTLFSSSRICNDDTLSLACEYIQRMRADMGGTNILGALSWIFNQTVQRGYPRQLFILTDGSMGNTAKIIELVRKNASSIRCFSYGLGPNACKRLLHGVAKVTGGTVEFFKEGERLQPKLIKSLKKAIEPVMSDITIEWYLPDTLEVLLSPTEIGPLYPGEHLISYGVLFDLSGFQRKKNTVKPHSPKAPSRGSTSSVFQTQEDPPTPTTSDSIKSPLLKENNGIEEALKEISREISLEFSGGNAEENEKYFETDPLHNIRKRIYHPSYIHEQYTLTHCSVSSERGIPTTTHGSNSSDSTEPHDMESASLPHGLESITEQGQKSLLRWELTRKPFSLPTSEMVISKNFAGIDPSADESRKKRKVMAQAALSNRSFSSPNGQLDMHHLHRALEKVSTDRENLNQSLGGRINECGSQQFQTNSLSRKSLTDSSSLSFQASTPDWDTFFDPESLFSPVISEELSVTETDSVPAMHCKSVIYGLICGKPVTWDVTTSLTSLYGASIQEEPMQNEENVWKEILHQLAAQSVIKDFENMAEKESEIEYGSSKIYRLKAIQTSKACNCVSTYTTTIPVDTSTQDCLSSFVEVRNTGVKLNQKRGSGSGSRRQRSYSMGLGRRCSSHDSEGLDDSYISTGKEDSATSPTSIGSSSSGWERQSALDGSARSSSIVFPRSQKAVENLFRSRINLGWSKILNHTGKSILLKPTCLSSKLDTSPTEEIADYLPLVQLQLASGAFVLNKAFSEALKIPLDRIKRASPFSSHRVSISLLSRCVSLQTGGSKPEPLLMRGISAPSGSELQFQGSKGNVQSVHRKKQRYLEESTKGSKKMAWPLLESDFDGTDVTSHDIATSSPENLSITFQQTDSGRGSETDLCENSPVSSEASNAFCEPANDLDPQDEDLEGMGWATAVALGWLEHQCASYFVEWELIAAKADSWLQAQHLPEGVNMGGLKVAARQLFLLLRHWNENIKLNMLCYNPNNM
ncbi:von Willebrand factor A domain-containing protein 5B1 [Callorhinchus milii]|uniref:von Willebrand factor A domain-containing protein 5B1 n=1 Tax=Callorhinchus milii TaxID=7868 RepID=UPI001C3FC23A|nr:von Willebrand factor A domain-containing protein 5B1 [Callorhinchus milii]